jgi:phosphoribosylformylglycinamidine cyclo-ligase
MISNTHSFASRGKVLSGFGGYAGILNLGGSLLALHADGVGSKVIVAQMMNRFDTVGLDCIAMNVNDILCVGARPQAFLDYIALKSANELVLKEIVTGLVKGASESEVAIIGGETAILPDVISGYDDRAFDLAGMAVGILENASDYISGNNIVVDDVILGVESSGLHSNGYTLARQVLLSRYSLEEIPRHMPCSVGEELLIPTKLYVKPVTEILEHFHDNPVHGLAHITGGSFTKLSRSNKKVNYILDNLPSVEGIFKQIQIDGRLDPVEMYRTFNMGIGFCVLLPRNSVEHVVRIFEKYHMNCLQIGRVEGKGLGKVIAKLGHKNRVL